MKASLHMLAAVLILVLPQLSFGQEFLAWEGKNSIGEGQGGVKKTVGGIDFWAEGAPPRKFQLGYIYDKRHESGLVGKIRMASLEKDFAKKAKEVGADAVILVNAESDLVGIATFGSASTNASVTASGNSAFGESQTFGGGVTRGIRTHESKYAVVK